MDNDRHTTDRPDLTIIAPMYNEEENVPLTIAKIEKAMDSFPGSWEFILVNDGSTDRSFERARELAASRPYIRVIGYDQNAGRGRALRTGFDAARGRIVATVDFDLSYSPDHVRRMYDLLESEPDVDLVLASAYMPGGKVVGVSLARLLPSRLGNLILSFAFPGRPYTTTCVVRAYRREVLDALPLVSDRKEIHLEILSKAITLGFRYREMPATLRARAKGPSKSNFLRTSVSHLHFTFTEKPRVLLVLFAAVLAVSGLADAAWLLYRWRAAGDSPGHPLLALLAVFATAGLLLLAFDYFSKQFLALQKAAVTDQSRCRLLARELSEIEKGRED